MSVPQPVLLGKPAAALPLLMNKMDVHAQMVTELPKTKKPTVGI
jgi:hypothetical protein